MCEKLSLGCNLDVALDDLGMLSTVTKSRMQYLEELRQNRVLTPPTPKKIRKEVLVQTAEDQTDIFNDDLLTILQLNTRYVSNISRGRRMKMDRLKTLRQRPYTMPERNRTKSENADCATVVPNEVVEMELTNDNENETVVSESKVIKLLVKKSKSLENIHVENVAASQPSHEMEFVSSRIQKLKVQE